MLDKQVDTSGKSGTEMRQVERKRREPRRAGISIKRFFTEGLEDPFAEVKWEKRDALISGADGQVIFEQRDVEVPSTWSQMATNVVVQKYFRGQLGTPGRETSVRQLISRVADTITVLRDGSTVARLDCRQGVSEGEIIRDMVGRSLDDRYPPRAPEIDGTVMTVDGWTVHHPLHADRKVVDNVSFHVRKGEVLGIAGLMGAGRTELAMSLFGRSYGRDISGSVAINGKAAGLSTVRKAIEAGIAYATEDRKTFGLVLDDTIRRNIPLARLEAIADRGIVDRHREADVAERYRKRLAIKSSSIEQETVNLSGGNQQKVVLSKWLFADPDILILDEPTRGIDVGAKFEIYTVIRDLAASGKAVIVISSEMPELLGITDRLYVMNEGRFVDEMPTSAASQERIMASIIRSGDRA